MPSGQATREVEEEEKKKGKKKGEATPDAFKTEPIFGIEGEKQYPGETQRTRKLRQKELSRQPNLQASQKKKKAQAKNEQHSVLFLEQNKALSNTRRGQQFLSPTILQSKP